MYNEWQVHHAGMHACSSAQHLGSTSSSHSCCPVWNRAAHTCLQVSHQSLRQQGSFQEVRFVLKRIKNHSKVRVTGFQDSLALPLLSLMPGEACALLFTNGKIRCCTSMLKAMLYCQWSHSVWNCSLPQGGGQTLSRPRVHRCRGRLHSACSKSCTLVLTAQRQQAGGCLALIGCSCVQLQVSRPHPLTMLNLKHQAGQT